MRFISSTVKVIRPLVLALTVAVADLDSPCWVSDDTWTVTAPCPKADAVVPKPYARHCLTEAAEGLMGKGSGPR